MKVLDTAFVKGFIRVCNDGFNQNRHRRSGGNLSYRTEHEEVESVKEELSCDGKWQPTGISISALTGEYFMVPGNGRFIRNMIPGLESNCCIIKVDQAGENHHICWGLTESGRPTSELPTRPVSHEVKMKITEGRYRVIYRVYLANIIVLTFVLPLTGEVFTRELWKIATGCPVVFPSDIGVAGWVMSGGRDIAVATNRLMEEHDVAIWTHRGLLCMGEDFGLIFGLMHTTEKPAETLVKVLSIRPDKLQTITPQDFRSLTADFHINPPEEFLYEKQEE